MPSLKQVDEEVKLQFENNSSFYSDDSTKVSIYEDNNLSLCFDKSLSEVNINHNQMKEHSSRSSIAYLDRFSSVPTLVDRKPKEFKPTNNDKKANFYKCCNLKSEPAQTGFKKSSRKIISTVLSNFQNISKDRKSILIDKNDISPPIWLSANEYQKIQDAYNKKPKQIYKKVAAIKKSFNKESLNKSVHPEKNFKALESKHSYSENSILGFKTRESYVQAYNKERKNSLQILDSSIFDQSLNEQKSIMNLVSDNTFFYDDDNNNKKLKRLSSQIKSQYQLLKQLEKP